MTTEPGVVSRQRVQEEISKSNNNAMHRDGTTKKGHHYYGVEFSTNGTLIAELREVKDGKANTYVDCVDEVINDIRDDGQILRKVSKIEKVPRGIRGEKSSKDMASSSKDMASSRNLVSTIGAQHYQINRLLEIPNVRDFPF